MAQPFKADTLQVNRIITTGSFGSEGIVQVSSSLYVDTTGSLRFNNASALLSASNAGVLFISGTSHGFNETPVKQADVFFVVSGSTRSRGTSTRGTSLFLGDMISSGTIYAVQGFTGSLTQLSGGQSFIQAGSNIVVTTSSAGQITIAGTAGASADIAASYITIANTASLSNERALAAGTGIALTDAGANSTVTVAALDSILATLTGSVFSGTINVSGNVKSMTGFSGSLTKLYNGDSFIQAGFNTTVATGATGQLTIGLSAFNTGSTLNQAYNTGGSTGAGAKITVDSQPVQLSVAGAQNLALVVTGNVLIASGTATGQIPSIPADTYFMVSGAHTYQKKALDGVSLFNGDVAMSGNVHNTRGSLFFDIATSPLGNVPAGGDVPGYGRGLIFTFTSVGSNTINAGDVVKMSGSTEVAQMATADVTLIQSRAIGIALNTAVNGALCNVLVAGMAVVNMGFYIPQRSGSAGFAVRPSLRVAGQLEPSTGSGFENRMGILTQQTGILPSSPASTVNARIFVWPNF